VRRKRKKENNKNDKRGKEIRKEKSENELSKFLEIVIDNLYLLYYY
jgi:RNA:NAD 2'-phosphotransferase (TPT1/KptA family)